MCDTPEAIKTSIHELRKRLDKVETTLFTGNGKPSLLERFAALERAQQTQTWLLRLVVGGVFAQLATSLVVLFRHGGI